jgi:hypothetical protein
VGRISCLDSWSPVRRPKLGNQSCAQLRRPPSAPGCREPQPKPLRPFGVHPDALLTTRHQWQLAGPPATVRPRLARRQGQALRVLRNLDSAGRGRATGGAGSEGIRLLPHQGNTGRRAERRPLVRFPWRLCPRLCRDTI